MTAQVLRTLTEYRDDLLRTRTQAVNMPHRLLVHLAAAGLPKWPLLRPQPSYRGRCVSVNTAAGPFGRLPTWPANSAGSTAVWITPPARWPLPSPVREQIAGWLRRHFPDDPEMQVSHEAIYLALFDPRGKAIDRTLTQRLRTGRPMRSPKRARKPDGRGVIRDSCRSVSVRSRSNPGRLPVTGKAIR
uniref:hypothetical protein n=1 Tax=Nocardia jinanensis TaxID=382504 RepID=UPI0018F8CBEF|nr:hypothetical protein [Nocardia jinanensis]